MKEQIVQELRTELEALGLSPVLGTDSDVTIDAELFEANVGSGQKSVRYENAILVDVADSVIYLYEKTTEKSKGFSFGSGGESTFQSGKTLSRHVKGSYVGLNGASVSYDLDIGEISKVIRNVAERNGLKLKSVIRRKSAQSH